MLLLRVDTQATRSGSRQSIAFGETTDQEQPVLRSTVILPTATIFPLRMKGESAPP